MKTWNSVDFDGEEMCTTCVSLFSLTLRSLTHPILVALWIDNDVKFPMERFSNLLKTEIISKVRETEIANKDDASFLEQLSNTVTQSAYAFASYSVD